MYTCSDIHAWHESIDDSIKQAVQSHLEQSNVLYFPSLPFNVSEDEKRFLSPNYIADKVKNIAYHSGSKKLWGIKELNEKDYYALKRLMERYATSATTLVKTLFPSYVNDLQVCRTSLRPIQIKDRKSSYRKDDTRLHVDAFTTEPNHGNRIIRIFSNVNIHGEPRVWRVGESFTNVAKRFLPQIHKPFPGSAAFLRAFGLTKSRRSLYDHYMLQMHHKMKANMNYQQSVSQKEVHFPTATTWMTFTDSVSHAAMKGQHLFEQTFFIPVKAMQQPELSPLRILEGMLHRALV